MQKQHRSTERILDILELVSNSDLGLTLSELSQLLNIPKSSIFPIVHTLEDRRYLWQDPNTMRYLPGPYMHTLGMRPSHSNDMQPIINIMQHIVSVCNETCQFGVLDNSNVLYLAKVDSPQPIRMISWVGRRLPANAVAIGKALLSDLSDDKVRNLFSDGLPSLTPNTITDINILLAQLAVIRRIGIATENEESTPQLACWAIPLHYKGKVFAAFSISVPLFRCSEEKISLVKKALLDAQITLEDSDIPPAFVNF